MLRLDSGTPSLLRPYNLNDWNRLICLRPSYIHPGLTVNSQVDMSYGESPKIIEALDWHLSPIKQLSSISSFITSTKTSIKSFIKYIIVNNNKN